MRSKILMLAIILGECVGSAIGAEPDLSGKLTLFATGREQAIFEKASVKFEKQYPRVRVRFAESEGIDPLKALAEGTADVAVIGRMLSPEEKDFIGTVVGWEGIAIMVNASNRVTDINLNQTGDMPRARATYATDHAVSGSCRISVVSIDGRHGHKDFRWSDEEVRQTATELAGRSIIVRGRVLNIGKGSAGKGNNHCEGDNRFHKRSETVK